MIHGKWLVLDRYCEVYDLLAKYADAYFWDFNQWEIVPNSIVVLDGFCKSRGEMGLRDFIAKIRDLVHTRPDLLFVYCKASEAGETLEWHIPQLGFGVETMYRKMLVIGGGEMDDRYPCLSYDKFLERLWEIQENRNNLKTIDRIFEKQNKPYKFLYLSGRIREHRKYLLESFEIEGLLSQSLTSCLEGTGIPDKGIRLFHQGEELIGKDRPVHYLPKEYEWPDIRERIGLNYDSNFVKYEFFNGTWYDGMFYPESYIDTYFSVVAETAFQYPYSFRTEKIWKPVMAGHPWIAVTNRGFYRDMRNMGFKTFGHLIDESFDNIENCEERVKRVTQIIVDLCKQDLNSFLREAKDVCYYNQLHMGEVYEKNKREFPRRFIEFVGKHMRKDC